MTAPAVPTAAIRNCLVPILGALQEAESLLSSQDLHSHSRTLVNFGIPGVNALLHLCEAAEKRATDYRAQAAEDYAREIGALADLRDYEKRLARDEARGARKGEGE